MFVSDAGGQSITDLGNLDAYSKTSPRDIEGSVNPNNLNDWYRYSIGNTTNLHMTLNSAPGKADICIYAEGVDTNSVQAEEGDCYRSSSRVQEFEGYLYQRTRFCDLARIVLRERTTSGSMPCQQNRANYNISIWTEGEPGVTLSRTSIDLSENETQTYTVKLKTAPPSRQAARTRGQGPINVSGKPVAV